MDLEEEEQKLEPFSFLRYFFGEEPKEEVKIELEVEEPEVGFFSWLFGTSEENLAVKAQDGDTAVRPSQLNYYKPTPMLDDTESVEKMTEALQQLHLSLVLTPLVALLVFMCFVYSIKIILQSGKPLLLNLAHFVIQSYEVDKSNEVDEQITLMESLLTKNMELQQKMCLEELKKSFLELLESSEKVLTTTHAHLTEISYSVNEILQAVVPIKRRTHCEEMENEESGDSSKLLIPKA